MNMNINIYIMHRCACFAPVLCTVNYNYSYCAVQAIFIEKHIRTMTDRTHNEGTDVRALHQYYSQYCNNN